MENKYLVMVLFPDDTHAEFEANFSKEEKEQYEKSLQLSPFIKSWVITKVVK